MSMELDFLSLLEDDPGVSDLVEDRLYPSTFSQATADPCIRYQKVTGTPGIHMAGGDGLDASTMQVDVRGTTALSVFAVRDAVVAKLHAFRGVKGTTDFRLIELSSDRGVNFDETEAEGFYLGSLDFNVWSRAAA